MSHSSFPYDVPELRQPTGIVVPDRPVFAELAKQQRVVPVVRRLLADTHTPIGVYRALAGGPGTFLLESAASSGRWARYSFIGVRSIAMLTEEGGQARWDGDPPVGLPLSGDPLDALRATVEALSGPRSEGLPPLTGGMVGYLSYDVIRRLERLPDTGTDDLALPELSMMLATDLAVFDHHDGTLLLVANAVMEPDADEVAATNSYERAVGRLEAMTSALSRPAAVVPSTFSISHVDSSVISRTPTGEFGEAVEAAKEAIKAGECFQIVVSQRFETSTHAEPLDVYRMLRNTNPSPYMYLLRCDGFDIVGSSPEAHLQVVGKAATLRPIAGTRRRGSTAAEDANLAAELIADPKERAEHVMLVDLARNDLGRVCRTGSVEVAEFMAIERYSHVMHIVSTVQGLLDDGHDAFSALTATFPAGTLTGAPKVRAMEIIDKLEPTRRGLYGGTVGYLDFAGDLDMAIAIRTALMRDGMAYVQAGAGVVADSTPEGEETETRNKAAAVLVAIRAAETITARHL